MTTLREAAQQALEALEMSRRFVYADNRPQCDDAIAALRTALAQEQAEPAQEPVAWRYKPMIGSPWSLSDDGYYVSCKRDKGYIVEPLYTTLPQRKPLTQEESDNIYREFTLYQDRLTPSVLQRVVRAVERAHGIIGSEIKEDSRQTLDDAMQQPRAMAQAYESGYKVGQVHEREACAKLAESTVCDTHLPTGVRIYGTRAAAAIRARSNARSNT